MEIKSLTYIDCPFCVDGKQTQGGQQVDCPSCGGTGLLETGKQILEPYVIHTYQVMEATDQTEYGNLSDSNKNAYNMILQCGIVDLTDGTQIRTNLWAMFDSESTTRANLIILLGE